MKRTAFSDFTFYPDGPTHQLRQLAANRQAEPCPPIFVGGGTVGLRKGVEDRAVFFRRDAYASVTYGKMQQTSLTVRLRRPLRLCP